ncbi:MAG: cupredoxin domain-containing protein [Acidimicrobiia bacterium]
MKNDDSPSERPGVWDRVLAAAAATVALWAVLVSFLAGEVLPFAVGLGVLYGVLAAAALLWPGRVVYWVAIVVSIVTLAGGAQFVVSDLGHPESALAFVPALLPELARLTVIFAAVGALRRWDTNLARRVVRVSVGVFVVLALVSVGLSVAQDDDVAQSGDLLVESKGILWIPDLLTAPAGQVGVFIENRDPVRHTFVIEQLDVEVEVPTSTSRRVEFSAPAGTYQIICTVPGHANMTGTLVISG